jgi:predicted cation transporter
MIQTVVMTDIALMVDVKEEKKNRAVSMIRIAVLAGFALTVDVNG